MSATGSGPVRVLHGDPGNLYGGDQSGTPGKSERDVWHLITGEYPPETGGVGDYSARLADGLARSGHEVHVWAPSSADETTAIPGVTVHREAGRWSRSDLGRLDACLDAFPEPRRLLVQYVPNVWNRKGMNVGFCRWLLRRRRRGDSIRLMFHEVRYHPVAGDRPVRWLLVAVQTAMARILLRAANCVYVSVPAWADLLRRISPRSTIPVRWTPVLSNIEPVVDPEGVAIIRRRLATGGGAIIGTFGTFRETTAAILADAYPVLLRDDPSCVGLLIGRGGESFARRLISKYPELSGRIFATGALDASDVSRNLQACDLLLQPDTGGVCTKQSSTMSCLAQGRAIVAGVGWMTEPIWAESGCVALARSPRPDDLIATARELLADPVLRNRLGEVARASYDRLFSASRAIASLTEEYEAV